MFNSLRLTLQICVIGSVVLTQSNAQERSAGPRRVGPLQEVFAWSQLTYNINGRLVVQDRFGEDDLEVSPRNKRQADQVFFNNNDEPQDDKQWDNRPIKGTSTSTSRRPSSNNNNGSTRRTTTTTSRPSSSNNNVTNEEGQFFIQYNNLPMGVERHNNRLFVTVPRRRYGVPSTLNYLDLNLDKNIRSPSLRPYPNLRESRALTSVYRTRIDSCDRMWMVDTGILEIPGNFQQVQPAAIVVFDLKTDRVLFRHDIREAQSPQGLASITVDVVEGDCQNTFAYIPDLATFAIIVYSLRENDTWRVSHNYFHFNPVFGNLNIAGQRFQWNDGIFSITLSTPGSDGCKAAYFHPMASNQEFAVSTCALRNRTASEASDYWERYSLLGERGDNSQCTMHDYHAPTKVIFFADIGRNGLSCWNTGTALTPSNVALLAQDSQRISYPADLHVTGDEVWILANTLPRFIYSRFDTNQHNFFIYRARVQDLIHGTVCNGFNSDSTFNK